MSISPEVQAGQYTIKQVAALTGVQSTTLRAWERRYGVPAPPRGTNRYRLFRASEVDEIQRMRALIDLGTAPRLAAEQVRAARPRAGYLEPEAFVDGMVREHYADDRRAEHVEAGLSSGPLEDSVESWLMPVLRQVGEEWVTGRLTISDEHALANTVMRRLGVLYDGASPPSGGPRILVGLPQGCRHQIGPFVFAVIARRAGFDVSYLGGDLPVDAWLRAVERFCPVAAVTAAHRLEDVPSVDELCTSLRSHHPDVVLGVGGSSQPAVTADRVVRLGHRFKPAVDYLRRRLDRRG